MKNSPVFFLFLILFISAAYTVADAEPTETPEITKPPSSTTVELVSQIPTYYLHYQGRLLEPGSNKPKADGNYNMTFNLYNQEVDGTALWSENKSLGVSNGLFSTNLGDVTPFNLNDFNGQDLWLGVTVGSDPEAAPRQQLTYAPYALNAAMLGGLPANNYAVEHETIWATDIQYSSPRTHYLSIPGAAFQPRLGSLNYESGSSNAGTFYSSVIGTNSDQMHAPVYLPDGAYIESMTAYFYDGVIFDGLTVRLTRHPNFSGYLTMAEVDSVGLTNGVESMSTNTVSSRVIDNSSNGYTIGVYVTDSEWGTHGSSLSIHGVVIEYTLSEAQ